MSSATERFDVDRVAFFEEAEVCIVGIVDVHSQVDGTVEAVTEEDVDVIFLERSLESDDGVALDADDGQVADLLIVSCVTPFGNDEIFQVDGVAQVQNAVTVDKVFGLIEDGSCGREFGVGFRQIGRRGFVGALRPFHIGPQRSQRFGTRRGIAVGLFLPVGSLHRRVQSVLSFLQVGQSRLLGRLGRLLHVGSCPHIGPCRIEIEIVGNVVAVTMAVVVQVVIVGVDVGEVLDFDVLNVAQHQGLGVNAFHIDLESVGSPAAIDVGTMQQFGLPNNDQIVVVRGEAVFVGSAVVDVGSQENGAQRVVRRFVLYVVCLGREAGNEVAVFVFVVDQILQELIMGLGQFELCRELFTGRCGELQHCVTVCIFVPVVVLGDESDVGQRDIATDIDRFIGQLVNILTGHDTDHFVELIHRDRMTVGSSPDRGSFLIGRDVDGLVDHLLQGEDIVGGNGQLLFLDLFERLIDDILVGVDLGDGIVCIIESRVGIRQTHLGLVVENHGIVALGAVHDREDHLVFADVAGFQLVDPIIETRLVSRSIEEVRIDRVDETGVVGIVAVDQISITILCFLLIEEALGDLFEGKPRIVDPVVQPARVGCPVESRYVEFDYVFSVYCHISISLFNGMRNYTRSGKHCQFKNECLPTSDYYPYV